MSDRVLKIFYSLPNVKEVFVNFLSEAVLLKCIVLSICYELRQYLRNSLNFPECDTIFFAIFVLSLSESLS